MATPLLDEHVEDPVLLLLVLDRLVVHHAEAAQQAVERLLGAVVAQRLQGLEPIGRLRELVDGALDVASAGALFAPLLREEIQDAHVV